MNTKQQAELHIQHNDARSLEKLIDLDPSIINWTALAEADSPLLHYAAKHKAYDCAETLLKHGENVNHTDRLGFTPIGIAASCDDIEMMRKLQSHGAHINIQSLEGFTPIFNAKSQEGLKFLLEHGADVKVATLGEQCTPLHYAASDEKYTTLMLTTLISAGADVNAKDLNGNTPLHDICLTEQACEVLLQHGANPQERNNFKRTCLLHNDPERKTMFGEAQIRADAAKQKDTITKALQRPFPKNPAQDPKSGPVRSPDNTQSRWRRM